jgi:hypothetical protein
MAVGIGGGGFLGIAFEVLAPPVQSALATNTSGGTISAGTYKYIVTAINANGETSASNEQTITTTGSASTVTVTWVAVTGATGYKLYKTSAGGSTGTELLYKTVGLVTTDTDTSPGSPAGAFPTTNSATSPLTYAPPTKFIPIRSESLQYQEEKNWRRPIRQLVDVLGAVAGDVHTEGDVEVEVLEDCQVYWHMIARETLTKTGGPTNYTYDFVPNDRATPNKTASITIVRNGIVFGYTGCVVHGMSYSIDNGLLISTLNILGSDELVQSVPVATWPTTVPFGAGQYSFQIPTGNAVTDSTGFEFNIQNNGEPQYRLKDTGRGAQFIKYGERAVTLSLERDFESRTDYDNFKLNTSQSVTMTASKGANNQFTFDIPAAIKESYEIGLSGQGDLVRGAVSYQSTYDSGTGRAYKVTIKTQENAS